jgi:uncharacterized membrane protein YfcA
MLLETLRGRGRGRGCRPGAGTCVEPLGIAGGTLGFAYAGDRYRVRVEALLGLSVAVGLAGGVYGIGGGALAAPFLIWLFGLPVHAIAGAALGATFLSSAAGVVVYWLMPAPEGVKAAPDWGLGLLLGAGGLAGTYLGASLQRHVSQTLLKAVLGALSLLAALRFLLG